MGIEGDLALLRAGTNTCLKARGRSPRLHCVACQPVAFMISASVAPLARCISAITSAFLLARAAFFTGLAFLAGVRFAFITPNGESIKTIVGLIWLRLDQSHADWRVRSLFYEPDKTSCCRHNREDRRLALQISLSHR